MITCPECGRVFGGVVTFDRHFDRRRDRCKTDAHLKRLGIVANDAGVYARAAMDPQPPLIDKRHVSRVPKRNRRANALGDAHVRGGQRGVPGGQPAPEPAPRLQEVAP